MEIGRMRYKVNTQHMRMKKEKITRLLCFPVLGELSSAKARQSRESYSIHDSAGQGLAYWYLIVSHRT